MSGAPGVPQRSHRHRPRDTNLSWQDRALCKQVDPEIFFPDKSRTAVKQAKKVCGSPTNPNCPVRTECLLYALVHHERDGIWGGMSETERRALQRARKAASWVSYHQ